MHKILMRTIVFDLEPDVHDAALEFWTAALGAHSRQGINYPEYHALEHPATTGPVMTQILGGGESRIHLDIESDDPPAEVARLTSLGATVEKEFDDWTILRDPAGILFCVVPAESEDFPHLAKDVG